MRKPRVIIYDDEIAILHMLKQFFTKRGYEVWPYNEPIICPHYERPTDRCENLYPCADVMISDFQMPKMSGIELFQHQAKIGCEIDAGMKAIMSGNSDEKLLTMCKELGCRFLQKPYTLPELSAWISECEKLFDLSQRLDKRSVYMQKIEFFLNPAASHIKYNGITIDKSISGLGLQVFHPLSTGNEITIINGLEVPNLNGTVLWCNKMGENIYRAGLRLLHR